MILTQLSNCEATERAVFPGLSPNLSASCFQSYKIFILEFASRHTKAKKGH